MIGMKEYWEKVKAAISLAVGVIATLLVAPELANAVYQLFAQFWQGFSRAIDPEVVPYLARAKHSRAVLMQSVFTNIVLYTGLVLVYEAGVRNVLRYGLPAMEDSWAEFGMDLLVRTCMLGLQAHFFVDNTMLTAGVQQAGMLDNPEADKSCPHDTLTKIQSRLASAAYYAGNAAAISGIEGIVSFAKVPYLVPVVSVPLRSIFYGRYFVEQGVGRLMCTNHRNGILNRNNPYTIGMGLSFTLALWFSGFVLRRTIGVVDSRYVNDAIFALLFQYYLMLAYSNKKPLPGREPGVDFSLPVRESTRWVMRNVVDTVTSLLGYDLVLMSDLPEGNKENAEKNKIYLSPNGKYVVRDVKGNVREGLLDINHVGDIKNKFHDQAFYNDVLKNISKSGYPLSLFGGSNDEIDWKLIENALNYYLKMMATNRAMIILQRLLFFGVDWSSREKFLRRPIPMALFPLFEETWRNALRDLTAWCQATGRKKTAVNAISWAEWMVGLKFIPDYKKQVVILASSKDFILFLNRFNGYLDWINAVQMGEFDRPNETALDFRERPVSFVNSPTVVPLLTAAPPSSQSALPSVETAAIMASVSAASAPAATLVLSSASAPSSVPPIAPAVNKTVADVAATLKAIAGLPVWQQQGAGLFGSKVPEGVEKIRAIIAVDIHALYDAIKGKLGSNAISHRGLPAGMTNQFYILIKECFERRQSADACFVLIKRFADNKLSSEERKQIELMPQQERVALRR